MSLYLFTTSMGSARLLDALDAVFRGHVRVSGTMLHVRAGNTAQELPLAYVVHAVAELSAVRACLMEAARRRVPAPL